MADPTTNFGWDVPTPGGDTGAWGTILNTAFDDIDADLQTVKDTADTALTTAQNNSTTRSHEHSNVTGAGTGANTTEQTLMSHTLPTLASGDMVELFVQFNLTGTNDLVIARVKLGTTTVWESSYGTAERGVVAGRVYLVKDGATTRTFASFALGTDGVTALQSREVSAELSGGTINVAGQTSNASDEVTAEALVVTKTTAP